MGKKSCLVAFGDKVPTLQFQNFPESKNVVDGRNLGETLGKRLVRPPSASG